MQNNLLGYRYLVELTEWQETSVAVETPRVLKRPYQICSGMLYEGVYQCL